MKTTFPRSAPKEIEREIATLERDFDEIIKHAGKYVLIRGDSIVSYSQTYSEAVNKGYKLFGLDNFLVRQVRLVDTPVRAMRCGAVKHDGKLRLTRAKRR